MVTLAGRRAAQDRVIAAVWRDVRRILAVYPVPVSDVEREDLAARILRYVLHGRSQSHHMALTRLAEEAPAGVRAPAPTPRPYGSAQLAKVMENVVDDGPAGGRVRVEYLDPETKILNRQRVPIDESNRDDPQVRAAFIERMRRSVATHVEAGYRDAMIDASHEVERDEGIQSPKGRVKLGYARVLTGAESCAFCAMLASRGPVYETAYSAGENHDFHRGCDCEVVPVYDGVPWEGEAAYEELEALWLKNSTLDDFRAAWRDQLKDGSPPSRFIGDSFRK